MTTYYLTTPIFYANDVPHTLATRTSPSPPMPSPATTVCAGVTCSCSPGRTSTASISNALPLRAVLPQEHVDAIAASFRDLWAQLDISYDRFVRTTEPAHRRAALALWQRLQASGDLYRGSTQGAYCSRCEAYYQIDELDLGTDCPVHRLPCEQVQEENWFFRLSHYQDALERLVRDTDFVQPESRRKEVLGVLAQGLRDFSVSRRQVRWGIPVPDACLGGVAAGCEPEREPEAPDEVLYVWVDALANYLTGSAFQTIRRRSSATGRPTCTSSARRSSAFTVCTGRRSCSAPGCRCRDASLRTGG